MDDTVTILRARIALLSTAIGGPDYSSKLETPPYKLGDDCLACLQDLKRWFKLVDDQQNTWDVAMAAAEYKILTDDLIPILLDWENKSSLQARLTAQNNSKDGNSNDVPVILKNKLYHDKIALQCLQLLTLMTWPLVITEQSSINQVKYYSDLKKHQLIYKKAILTAENGKVLRAVIRIVLDVMKTDKLFRTPKDNLILKIALNFFRNIIAIEPGELMITNKKKPAANKGIEALDTLPQNVSMEDISLNTVVSTFHKNKVFSFLLTLSSTLTTEFDQDFINLPLLEIMFYLTKDINPALLFTSYNSNKNSSGHHNNKTSNASSNYSTKSEMELSDLLKKEFEMKKNLIKNTSSRHSRFGALVSIKTSEDTRLTVSGSQNILNDLAALNKLDSSKKWNKRITRIKEDPLGEGLPNSLLNSQVSKYIILQKDALSIFAEFINNFVDSSFNILLRSVTNYMTTEEDRIVIIEQVEYLLFFAWFVKYQRIRCIQEKAADIAFVAEALRETTFILVSHLLRKSFEMKSWIVVHSAMIAFNELLLLLENDKLQEFEYDDVEFIASRLFSDERIQLLSNLPRMSVKHTPQYMKSCIDLTHTVLKTLEKFSSKERGLVIQGKARGKKKANISESDIIKVMEERNLDRDDAIEILTPSYKEFEVNFQKVQNSYINDATIDTYINFLQRFKELDNEQIKRIIAFFHRVFIQAKEEAYLFRLDLIVLFQRMLAADGLARDARVRKHVERFVNYYLGRLKKRLKNSPSWFVELLFPLLHDSEVGFYQRYDEMRKTNIDFYGAEPSGFIPLPDEEALPLSALKNMKFGILVSTLVDDSKLELLEALVTHICKSLDIFKSWLSVHVLNEDEMESAPNEYFSLPTELGNPILLDRDFRALLKLVGYSIPSNRLEKCYLPGDIDITDLEDSISLIKKYLTTSFETPNGLSSASYLDRKNGKQQSKGDEEEDGWKGNEHYDYNDPSIIRDDEIDDIEYFEELDNPNSARHSKKLPKGIASTRKAKKAKGKKWKSNALPLFDVEDDTNGGSTMKPHSTIASKEYIDSDDEDEALNPIFYENEMFMRWLLDKHNGQLSMEKNKLFAKFANERMANNGKTTSDFTELFDGPIPSIAVSNNDSSISSANKLLLHFNSRIESKTGTLSEENTNSKGLFVSSDSESHESDFEENIASDTQATQIVEKNFNQVEVVGTDMQKTQLIQGSNSDIENGQTQIIEENSKEVNYDGENLATQIIDEETESRGYINTENLPTQMIDESSTRENSINNLVSEEDIGNNDSSVDVDSNHDASVNNGRNDDDDDENFHPHRSKRRKVAFEDDE